MMKNSQLRVSLVIPAYNEESYLVLCLDAIAAQTVRPFEVIVVDNNSTDNTAAVARRYRFVTIVRETKQGLVFARDRGFNAARGDIIGRLDCDSLISPDWVERVQQIFADTTIDAVSGQVGYVNVGLANVINALDGYIRRYMTRHMGALGEQFLYGSNMAIRRQSWQAVRSQVCHKQHLHEDIDLAAHLSQAGAKVVFDARLLALVDWRQAAAGPRQFWAHVWSNDWVFAEHELKSRRYARRVVWLVSCMYLPIHVLYRGYNPRTQRFSISYLLANTLAPRISPVSDSV
jgi:glycosyltransferase involved in cell wall biosynthesis